MFTAIFKRQQDSFLFVGQRCERSGERRLSLGDSARFVQHNRVDVLGNFQTLGIFNEDALFRCSSDAHHECRGRCKPQCARTSDDQHGDGREQGPCEVAPGFVAQEKPQETRQQSQTDDCGNEDGRHFVHGGLNGSFRVLRLAYHFDDSSQHRLSAHFFSPKGEGTFLIERALKHLAACFFQDRHRFATQQTFVHVGRAVCYRAIDGDFLTRMNEQCVATLYFADFYLLLLPTAQDGGCLRAQSHEFFQRRGRVGLCTSLEQPANENEHDDAAGRVKIEVGFSPQHLWEEEVENTEQVGDAGGERYERVHV